MTKLALTVFNYHSLTLSQISSDVRWRDRLTFRDVYRQSSGRSGCAQHREPLSGNGTDRNLRLHLGESHPPPRFQRGSQLPCIRHCASARSYHPQRRRCSHRTRRGFSAFRRLQPSPEKPTAPALICSRKARNFVQAALCQRPPEYARRKRRRHLYYLLAIIRHAFQHCRFSMRRPLPPTADSWSRRRAAPPAPVTAVIRPGRLWQQDGRRLQQMIDDFRQRRADDVPRALPGVPSFARRGDAVASSSTVHDCTAYRDSGFRLLTAGVPRTDPFAVRQFQHAAI